MKLKLKPYKSVTKPKSDVVKVHVGNTEVGSYFFVKPEDRERINDSFYWEQTYLGGDNYSAIGGFCTTADNAVKMIMRSLRSEVKTNVELINKIMEKS